MAAQPVRDRATRGRLVVACLLVAAFVAACSSSTSGAGWTFGPTLSSSPSTSAAPAGSAAPPAAASPSPS
jgi:hypothetical protein